MAYCPKCGAEASGNFCSRCGASLTGGANASGSVLMTAGQSSSQAQPQPAVNTGADPANYKLGWHKFLTYFALWIAAASNLYYGAEALSLASSYGPAAVYGVLCIVCAAYAIYARFQLAGFKIGAPKKLLIFYGLSLVINLFNIGMAANLGVNDPSSSPVLVIPIMMMIFNWRYYSNREALFVN